MGSVELVGRVLVSLVVVLAVVWVLGRKFRKGGKAKGDGLIDVLGRQQLSRTASVAVVRVGGQALIVGITDAQVNVLGETDLMAALAATAAPAPAAATRRVAAPAAGPSARPVTDAVDPPRTARGFGPLARDLAADDRVAARPQRPLSAGPITMTLRLRSGLALIGLLVVLALTSFAHAGRADAAPVPSPSVPVSVPSVTTTTTTAPLGDGPTAPTAPTTPTAPYEPVGRGRLGHGQRRRQQAEPVVDRADAGHGAGGRAVAAAARHQLHQDLRGACR